MLFGGAMWKVHSGNRVKFWKDQWILTLPNYKLTPRVQSLEINMEGEVLVDRECRAWDFSRISTFLFNEEKRGD